MQLSSNNFYIVSCLGVIDIWWMNFSQGFFVIESRYIGPSPTASPQSKCWALTYVSSQPMIYICYP